MKKKSDLGLNLAELALEFADRLLDIISFLLQRHLLLHPVVERCPHVT